MEEGHFASPVCAEAEAEAEAGILTCKQTLRGLIKKCITPNLKINK